MLVSAALGLLAIGAFFVAVYGWDYPVEELSPDRGGPSCWWIATGCPSRQIPSKSGAAGRHAWVELDQVPAVAIATFLVSEDEPLLRARRHRPPGHRPRRLARPR
jgi:hypothetical protein